MNINPIKWFLLADMSNVEVVIVTLIKTNIHRSRLKLSNLSLEIMLHNLKLEVTKEYIIAKGNGKIDAFERRWGEIKKIMNDGIDTSQAVTTSVTHTSHTPTHT